MEFNNLEIKGKTFDRVWRGKYDRSDAIFFANSEEQFALSHIEECSEYVHIEDICGDLEDLVGKPLEQAEEAYREGELDEQMLDEQKDGEDHCTFSFYKLGTVKGFVSIRFYGESNGHYCEKAQLIKGAKEDETN